MDELFDAEGNLDTVKCKQLIPYGIGHFSQYASQELVEANFLRKRVAVVQDWLMHHTPNGIPALFTRKFFRVSIRKMQLSIHSR